MVGKYQQNQMQRQTQREREQFYNTQPIISLLHRIIQEIN